MLLIYLTSLFATYKSYGNYHKNSTKQNKILFFISSGSVIFISLIRCPLRILFCSGCNRNKPYLPCNY